MEETHELGSRSETHAKKEPPRKKRRFWKYFKIFLFISVTVGIIGGGAVAGFVATIINRAPALNLNAITNMAATTKVYDSEGQFMFALQGDGDRDLIKSLDQVSPYVVQAFIAAEDKNFQTHFGVNPIAIARAFVQNTLGTGIVSGASTITQQTIKNAMFPEQERSYERKIQEAYLAIQLEKRLTKDEIMVTYLNWIYFGKSGPDNLYGIERASKSIFGIPAKDLNLAQATVLAALPNNPSLFDAYDNLDNTLERQDYILSEMVKSGFITEAQKQEAKSYDVQKDIQAAKSKREIKAGEFAHLYAEIETRAAERLMETGKYDSLDQARQALFRGGYSIHTTIDRKYQQIVDRIIDNDNFYPPNITYDIVDNKGRKIHVENAMEQAGATLIENKTGRILAMGGGRKYEVDQVNHATRPRQPGSTMKPIAVYGPALDLKKIGAGTAIDDVPMVWPDQSAKDGKYFPLNWDKKFRGLVTVRRALDDSLNIPALKIFHDITPKTGLDYVRRMGVTTLTDSDNVLGAGIGGLTQGLTVTEATSAYSTIPNAGVWRDSYIIDEIKDRNGHSVYKHQSKTTQVFDPNAAYILNDMLRSVVTQGTASVVGKKFPGYPIAGKTGTTDDNKDAWFIGYTPDVTLGIWVGYNIPYELTLKQTYHPRDLWNLIMTEYFQMTPQRTPDFFPNPGNVRQVTVCRLSGKIPTDLCQEAKTVTTELFLAGTEPHDQCDVHVKAKYYEVGGKKYLANDSTPPYLVKEGIFIKRARYELPNNNKSYLPADYEWELPTSSDSDFEGLTIQSGKTPSGLKVTSSTTTSVQLSWNRVDGAKNYLVLRSESEAGPFTIAGETANTSYTDSQVEAGKTYSYKIVSQDNDGNHSTPSIVVTVTPGKAPAINLQPPSQIGVKPGAVGLTVTWTPVQGATHYTIYRSTEASSGFQKIGTATATSFNDIGALPGATFFYKVSAHVGNQESNASPPASASVPASGTPEQEKLQAPGQVRVTNPGPGTLTVSWTPVSGAIQYAVERSTDGSAWGEIGLAEGTTFTDKGLTPGQYFYRVRALGSNGSASSASVAARGTLNP
jgi:membrane peptidoglycan carboxypeptidase